MRTWSQPPDLPSASGPVFMVFAAHAGSLTFVRNTCPRPVSSLTISGSGSVTWPYLMGPDDRTKIDAPTASRNALRDDVLPPWWPVISTAADTSPAQHVVELPSIEFGRGATEGPVVPRLRHRPRGTHACLPGRGESRGCSRWPRVPSAVGVQNRHRRALAQRNRRLIDPTRIGECAPHLRFLSALGNGASSALGRMADLPTKRRGGWNPIIRSSRN
jgi:hypothetical protein